MNSEPSETTWGFREDVTIHAVGGRHIKLEDDDGNTVFLTHMLIREIATRAGLKLVAQMSQMDANQVSAKVTVALGRFLESMGKFPSSKQDYREARQHLAVARAQIEKAEEWFSGGWLATPDLRDGPRREAA